MLWQKTRQIMKTTFSGRLPSGKGQRRLLPVAASLRVPTRTALAHFENSIFLTLSFDISDFLLSNCKSRKTIHRNIFTGLGASVVKETQHLLLFLDHCLSSVNHEASPEVDNYCVVNQHCFSRVQNSYRSC